MKDARAELVRIDDHGVAHPIGSIASQRMRVRKGTFRLLPAPDHVVFMRYTGEDGRRDAEDGAIVRLSGEITAPGAMCDVFALLGQAGWRGELVVLDGEATRSLFFEQGSVVGAQTTYDQERLGAVMYRYGALTREQHLQITAAVNEGGRFGKVAVELGILTQEKVYEGLRRQTEEVVFSILTIGDGTFFFLEGFNEERLASRQVLSANGLLMDAVTRMDEIRYFREKIPSNDYVPVKLGNASLPPGDAAATFVAIDGALSIEELGRATSLGEFATTKNIYTLIQSKHVAVHAPRLSGGPPAIVAISNHALRLIHQAVDIKGRGTIVRQSLASFASGAGVYDILLGGAGPDGRGLLNPERVGENAGLLAPPPEVESTLRQMLHEYVSFALFCAGSALGSEDEAQLNKDVGPIVARLQPHP